MNACPALLPISISSQYVHYIIISNLAFSSTFSLQLTTPRAPPPRATEWHFSLTIPNFWLQDFFFVPPFTSQHILLFFLPMHSLPEPGYKIKYIYIFGLSSPWEGNFFHLGDEESTWVGTSTRKSVSISLVCAMILITSSIKTWDGAMSKLCFQYRHTRIKLSSLSTFGTGAGVQTCARPYVRKCDFILPKLYRRLSVFCSIISATGHYVWEYKNSLCEKNPPWMEGIEEVLANFGEVISSNSDA